MQQPDRFLNRELSWLEFNRRVLALAQETGRSLLERAKFLAIFFRNLDEFFQVRVANLQDDAASGLSGASPDGRSAAQQLELIRERVVSLSAQAQACFAEDLRPALATAGIEIAGWDDLYEDERSLAMKEFEEQIQPVLVPLAVDPAHPFPYVSALSLSVGALVRRRGGGPERFARVKVPEFIARFRRIAERRYVPVEEVILARLESLFPEDEILDAGLFRVTRDADLELRERDSQDLAEEIEASLRRRVRASDAVRLEVSAALGPRIRELLIDELDLNPDEVYEVEGLLDLGRLFEFYDLDRPELKDPPWTPRQVGDLPSHASPAAIFASLRDRDILVHHPYDSFSGSVESFLHAAAEDPAVRVIMSTIYRTGGPESGIVRALEGAAARGKQVVVLVELKARFDEAANLERARGLERAGAHVVYGLLGLKTHAKIALVVREEEGRLKRYCHVGTGNYNPLTAKLYEDLGLLTSSDTVTRDVARLCQRLTSGSGSRRYARLLVAPETLRAGLLERIAGEAGHEDGHIAIKVNSLSDPEIIDALYAASRAGARIDLVVRGICCLRPGVPGLSDRIRVRSFVGRFLEHSRIYRFGSAARGSEYWIGSADLLPRNLDARVEALVSVEDPRLCHRLDEILGLYLDPQVRAWELHPDGSWSLSAGRMDVQQRIAFPPDAAATSGRP